MILFVSRVHSGRRLQKALTMPFFLFPSIVQMGLWECSGEFTALSMWGAVIPGLFSFTDVLLRHFLFLSSFSNVILLRTEVTSGVGGLCSPLFVGLTGYMEPTCPHKCINQVGNRS